MLTTISKKLSTPRTARRNLHPFFWVVLALLAVGVMGCDSTSVAPYDQSAYEQDLAIKNRALDLMTYATEDYAGHQPEAAKLEKALEDAYQYELKRAHNDITIKMWEVLKSPAQDLLGGFLNEWREKPLTQDYIARRKGDENLSGSIGWAFDRLIKWESYKKSGFQREREALLIELRDWLKTKNIVIN